ncbi:PPC domain-containing DNA-binding protein [Actinoplanes couchii]|uniref:PPC domain-containing protein n=1 Tax=Actinoplanes couchii TaxID=403638 RepID=A0ABQ3XTK6_9ACTN|nr:PPC domain-containing DNA-binding protein [Actinoplanes couchii]MDR6318942.1 putative DNA-binding protein with PD1-like motif [Actinoplanes couchii]GID61851.1 hypothetical protein Aco03nite_102550 [Actinoplanes couchii]
MTHLIHISSGEEVLATLQDAADRLGIQAAGITLIGAVQTATISVMHKDDPKADRIRSYDQPLELSGTGEIINGEPHVHVTLCGEDLTVGGHLHGAVPRDFFVRAYVTPVTAP